MASSLIKYPFIASITKHASVSEDKTTVHGRRHETVLYTHHRVKERDLLKLANYRRLKQGLPLIRAVSTVACRARPTRLHSVQSRRHVSIKNIFRTVQNKTCSL